MSYNVLYDRATKHAHDVVSGKVVSGKLHRLACQRHLDDLKRQKTEGFPYYWDPMKSEEILEYAETLTIAEGETPKPVKLIPEQCFDLGVTFGWLKVANNKRRFRRRYKSVARQNGKTFENGIMGTYIAGFGGYNYGKLFTAATKKRQSRLAWEEMSKFISIDPDLSEYFEIKDYKNLIIAVDTCCTIEALSKEGGLDEGFRAIYASVDEIHQHRDNKIYKSLYNGTRSLSETLVSMITTRGDKLNSFCKEMDDYCILILNGSSTAEDFFVDIYALDDGDDIWDPQNWIKANPFIATRPDLMEILQTDAQTARDMGGSDLRDFLTKSLNLWVQNADDIFVNPDHWRKCGSDKRLSDMQGKSCWVGLDLSSGGDLTSYALEFPGEYIQDGEIKERYYIFSKSFMPRGKLSEHIETDLAPYDLWEQMGLITVTGSVTDFKNDYKFIIKDLREIKDKYDLTFLGIGIDPHNADGILSDLESFGCPVIIIVQSCKSLHDATTDFQLSVKSGDISYNLGNELLTWSVLNATVVRNSFNEIKIDKKPNARTKRIDPVDAVIDAHACRLKNKIEPTVNVESALDAYMAAMGWKKG